MGVKGFYGYCLNMIPKCHREVDIVQEIENCKDENPKLMINLHTLSYHFKIKKTDLICGYQLNKIKFVVENFFQKLKDCGAELIFVFQKPGGDNEEFLKRRLDDYKHALQLIENIAKIQDFGKLSKMRKLCDSIPFNVMITLCMIQSAEKYGKVYGFAANGNQPSVAAANLATKTGCKWILGLSTFKFLTPGDWKIWTDAKLDMENMKVVEIDKTVIMEHLQITFKQVPLFFCMGETLETSSSFKQKVANYFGNNSKIPALTKFVKEFSDLNDEAFEKISEKILGKKDEKFIEDVKKSLEKSSIEPDEQKYEFEPEIMNIIQNDFVSYAEEILLNKSPIFTTPVFMDLNSPDMINFNLLILPWIQKTVGILLKNQDDKEPRRIVTLQAGKFEKIDIDAVYPDFDVPPLDILLKGEMSTFDKMKILFWLMEFKLSDIEMPCFGQEYMVDCLILMYLIKKNSLTVLDARCILKTLVDARRKDIPLEGSTEYPKKVNSRALRCSYLYCKMYFILHSCLACFGMQNYRSELQFDGAYFQKMYALNVLDEVEEDENGNELKPSASLANARAPVEQSIEEKFEKLIIPNEKDVDQTDLVELFAKIIKF